MRRDLAYQLGSMDNITVMIVELNAKYEAK